MGNFVLNCGSCLRQFHCWRKKSNDEYDPPRRVFSAADDESGESRKHI